MQTDIYQFLLRPLLFSGLNVDPEWLKQQILAALGQICTHPNAITQWIEHQCDRAYCVQSLRLQQTVLGHTFANPVGLAAGFDKNGIAAGFWPHLGFGFAELGTVTWHGQPGNPRPRLFRLPQDGAAINRMGFNNHGATAMAQVLSELWQHRPSPIPIGINLGKSKITPLEEAAQDYRQSFAQLKPLGDYFVVNVSSPNTPGLRSLQATEQLIPIITALQSANSANQPILVKIAPDLELAAIAAILDVIQTYQLAGIIATNTTLSREGLTTQRIPQTGRSPQEEAGGLSGKPLRQRSTDIIRFIYQQTQGQVPIIGVGGIFTADDAWEKITAGASLVQTYTGWVYQGPWMIRRVLTGLLQKLDETGLSSISEAVGIQA
ncbi:MAG: quinone-dependent dihydroorotate dehydrogenase [Leptolyngbyaceae bacterium]|nr:quinone-dependent dihydroorotate dehydrogenase [Leptolyngbyaceae bacterium]